MIRYVFFISTDLPTDLESWKITEEGARFVKVVSSYVDDKTNKKFDWDECKVVLLPTKKGAVSSKLVYLGELGDEVKCVGCLGERGRDIIVESTYPIAKIRGCQMSVTVGGRGVPCVVSWSPGYIDSLVQAKSASCEKNINVWLHDLEKILTLGSGGSVAPDLETVLVNSEGSWSQLVEHIDGLSEQTRLAVDTETMGLCPFQPNKDLIMISLAADDHRGYSIPLHHSESYWNDLIKVSRVRDKLAEWAKKFKIVGHNFKFDSVWLKCGLGIDFPCHVDTMNAHHLLYAGSVPSDLESMANRYVGFSDHKSELQGHLKMLESSYFNSIVTKGHVLEARERAAEYANDWRNIPLGVLGPYAAMDAVATWRLGVYVEDKLRERKQWGAYQQLYQATHRAFWMMEWNGIKIDMPAYKKLYASFPAQLQEIFAEVKKSKFYLKYQEALGEFNLGSSSQKVKFIFDILGVPEEVIAGSRKAKKGKNVSSRSFDGEAQEEVIGWLNKMGRTEEIEVVKKIIEHSKLDWLFDNHSKNMADFIAPCSDPKPTPWSSVKCLPEKYTVHPNLQLVTRTGRASAKEPPIHGVPYKSLVKRQYVSRWKEGGGLIGIFDYSQMELRVLAALSKDPDLISAFRSGKDIHKYISSVCLGIPENQVSKEVRRNFKAITFGIVYQQGTETLAGSLGISAMEADRIKGLIFTRFSGIEVFVRTQITVARKSGEVWTPTGRCRPIPLTMYSKGEQERRAVNTPIQGAASDNTFLAACYCYYECEKAGLRSRPMTFIHDSVMFDIYPGEVDAVLTLAKRVMTDEVEARCPWFSGVPAVSEYEIGRSWGETLECSRVDDRTVELSVEYSLDKAGDWGVVVSEFCAATYNDFSKFFDHRVSVDGQVGAQLVHESIRGVLKR